mgnify:CR=1 FL=1
MTKNLPDNVMLFPKNSARRSAWTAGSSMARATPAAARPTPL